MIVILYLFRPLILLYDKRENKVTKTIMINKKKKQPNIHREMVGLLLKGIRMEIKLSIHLSHQLHIIFIDIANIHMSLLEPTTYYGTIGQTECFLNRVQSDTSPYNDREIV